MAALEQGKTVLFFDQNSLRAGLLLSPDDKHWMVALPDGSQLRLPAQRFVLVSHSSLVPQDMSALEHFIREARDLAARLPTSEIGESLTALTQPFFLDSACQVLGYDADLQRFALFMHLRDHPETYLQKKDLYRLRAAGEIEQFQEKIKQDAQRQDYLRGVQSYLEGGELDPSLRACLLSELRELILRQEPRDLLRVLRQTAANQSPEEQIHSLRLALGDLRPTTDPIAARAGIPVRHDPGLERFLSAPDLSLPETSSAFTIDAKQSPDYDDAISLLRTATGFRLGVHITEVGSRIAPDSPLFKVAAERVSSLYLPGESIPLLPESLTQGDLSLLEGEPRPALSLEAELDAQYRITGWQFRRQLLSVTNNYSYGEVDSSITREPFSELLAICRALQRERVGGPDERKQHYSWDLIVRDGQISFQRIDNLSPARFIIEELMILYNRLLAEQASAADLPLLFRNINQFEDSDEDFSPANGIQAYLSTEGRFHPGIGSRAYTHATSPIRRLADIINQQQFLAFLAGQNPPHTREGLELLIPRIEKRLLLLRGIGQRSERYWLLRLLEQKYLHTPLDALLLKKTHSGYLAELSRWGKRAVLLCKDRPPLQEPVKLVLSGVDLENLTLWGDVIF